MIKIQKNPFIALLLAAAFALPAASCGAGSAQTLDLSKDREGNSITLPPKIEKIISLGPSITEILTALGCAEKLIAVDTFSEGIEGLKPGLPMFSMMDPDGEKILDMQPDVIFVSGIAKSETDDPFKLVAGAGVCVVYIPSASSIQAVRDDIRFVAAATGTAARGEKLISDMEREIAAVKKIGDTITDKKSVYFEITAPPYMCTLGSETFIHEMIELTGGTNAFADQKEAWIYVTDEAVLEANPDVVLTCVNYLEVDPVDEIKSRPGWDSITAVKNDAVYYIDTDASNRPSHNIVKALKEMSKAIYPDKFQ